MPKDSPASTASLARALRAGQADDLDHAATTPIDPEVADAMMPKIDGFQLCKEVRAIPGLDHVPFIIYTGNYVDEADQEFARSIGVDRYVVKFAGMGVLTEAVNELAQLRFGRKPEHPSEDQVRLVGAPERLAAAQQA